MTDEPRGRRVPHDLEAEESLLGAMLLTTDAREAGLQAVTAAEFYKPAHGLIFRAIEALYAAGQVVDVVTVASVLDRMGKLAQIGGRGELMRLHAETPASAHAQQYAQVVAELALCRRAIAYSGDLSEAGYSADVDEVVRVAQAAPESLAPPSGSVEPGLDVLDVIETNADHDWLVRGLLERGDRLIVTGPEGGGKSTLLRQLAAQFAVGVHPFRYSTRIDPIRVLHVDLENSSAQSARAYRRMFGHEELLNLYRPGRLSVKLRPQGLDLTRPADVRWLDALVGHHRADLLVLGPLYKAFSGSGGKSKQSEEIAEQTAHALDVIRVRHSCALILEGHSPHDGDAGARTNYRPVGSSLWLRWPEFGFGLAPDPERADRVNVKRWRGDRERGRGFPDALAWGSPWPWVVPFGEGD